MADDPITVDDLAQLGLVKRNDDGVPVVTGGGGYALMLLCDLLAGKRPDLAEPLRAASAAVGAILPTQPAPRVWDPAEDDWAALPAWRDGDVEPHATDEEE